MQNVFLEKMVPFGLDKNIRYIILTITLLTTLVAKGQVIETTHKVDTLTAADRLSIRTNAFEWLLLIPNIGIEYDLGRYNYSRWSLGLNMRYNWQTSHTFKPGAIFNLLEGRLELRNYYRMRETTNYITPKKGFLNRLLSPRRENPKHPNTTYYRGAFIAYNKYTVKLSSEGWQGNAIIGGVMWGLVKPLYSFRNGNSLDFELGVGVGLAYTKYDTFTHDAFLDCYPKTGNKTTVLPVINDLRAGFVYRLGKYPVTKKYRWRYDVDMNYQSEFDNKLLSKRRKIENEAFNDSLEIYVRKLFWEKYDSAAQRNRIAEDSLRILGKDEKSLKRAERDARKTQKKLDKDAAREAERERIKQAIRDARNAALDRKPEAEEPEEPATPQEEKGGEP